MMPSDDDRVTDGVVHHSFIRPNGIISTAGATVNATSLLLHSRRDDLSDRPIKRKERQANPKTIAFADNLELLGRWNDDFRENERTDEFDNGRRGSLRTHPSGDDVNDDNVWNRQQREIPYALRFQKPLQRRICSQGGVLPDEGGVALQDLSELGEEYKDEEGVCNLCDRCKSGERIELGGQTEEVMRELGKLVHRAPHKETDAFVPFMIEHPIFTKGAEIGTMDLCPYLEAGACTWFSQSNPEKIDTIGNSGGAQRYDFAARATSRIKSSKSDSDDEAEDLSDAVFEAPYAELHSVRGAVGNDFVDLVMASPSLEVGVDLPNVTESIMQKAVRNIASYRQKAGRVGRESLCEALNVTIATDSPLDLHYYRQPRKLVESGRLEPVPLKERNEAVARSTGYLSIWDWLCVNCVIPEDFLSFTGENAVISLQQAVLELDDRAGEVRRHVVGVLNDDRFNIDSPWIEEARLQVLDELSLLLRPVSGYSFDPPLPEPESRQSSCIDAMIHMLGNGHRGSRAIAEGDTGHMIEELDEATKRAKKRRRECGFIDNLNPELLEKADRLIDTKSPNKEDLDAITEALRRLERELEGDERRAAKRLRLAFDDMEGPVHDLGRTGVDIDAFRLIEQYKRLASGENPSHKFYLSHTMRGLDCFKQLRRHDWFVSPSTLFIHPHMETVTLRSVPYSAIRQDQSEIPLDEALHSYLPGMWTKRLPQATFKVAARITEPVGEGSVLMANLDRMEQEGMRVRTSASALPAPPGRPDNRTIRVVTPIEIPLIRRVNPRYVLAERNGPRILDQDEGEPRGSENRSIRIPRSFTNRWLHIDLDEGTPIGPYLDLGDGERLVTTSPGGRDEADVGSEHLQHPFQRTAFESVEWHDEATVIHYIFGLNRTISTDQGYGSELIYQDGYGREVAFGRKIRTEGIGFRLHPEIVGQTTEAAISGISEGMPEWAPTMVRALRSHLAVQSMETGGALSSFDIDDVISILLAGWSDRPDVPIVIEDLVSTASTLLEDDELMAHFVTRRVEARMGSPDEEGVYHAEDEEARLNSIDRMTQMIRRTLGSFSEGPEAFLEFLPLWIHRTILMSFGVTAVTALQRISGGDMGEIGYGLTDDSWSGEDSKVILFDMAERGNGNVSVARTFMHIPNIIRSARGRRGALLPSMDFMSTLEETLLPCPQHHSDLLGLEYRRTDGEDSILHRSMSDLRSIGQEVFRVSGQTWKSLGIEGPNDGWKIPLIHLMRREVADTKGLARDDVTRATKVCWNGCPECSERIDVVQGGKAGMDYLDRMLLDSWFRHSREATADYHHIAPGDIVSGDNQLCLGALHTLALRTENQRLRSTLQPWTIGIDVPRSDPSGGLNILIRESDIVGLRTDQEAGVIVGTPATSVKRLLWFNLLMTAYLDLSGRIPEDRREVTLVYYDAREVSFQDVGMAPRMLDAIREAARADGINSVENLSDVLIWLARRGFQVRLCVDAGVRAQEGNEAVREFLGTLSNARTGGNLRLLEREVRDPEMRRRNMHKKILVTPIYALSGSANLTYSGTTSNEEILTHTTFGDPNYDSVRTGCEDTIAAAREIT